MPGIKKESLIKLLQDPDIQQRIQHIAAQSRPEPGDVPNERATPIEQLQQQLHEKDAMIDELKTVLKKFKSLFQQEEQKSQALQTELSQTQQQAHTFERQLTEQHAENQHLEKQVQTHQQTLQSQAQQIQQLQAQLSPFQPLLEAYARYQQLSTNTQRALKGIFPQDTLSVFIAAGLQQKNIESLYDYLKNEIIEGQNADQSHLIIMFNHLLDHFLQGMPKYEKTEPVAQQFDPTQHIKTPDSAPSGVIKTVLLPGWRVHSNQTILKRPIVTL